MGGLAQRLFSQQLFQPLADALLTPTETAVLWGLHHPYWLGAIAILMVIGLQVGVSLAGQLVRRILKEIGRSPFSLGRWLFHKTTVRDPSPDQKLETILNRLNSLQEEQASLLAEFREQLSDRE